MSYSLPSSFGVVCLLAAIGMLIVELTMGKYHSEIPLILGLVGALGIFVGRVLKDLNERIRRLESDIKNKN